MRPPMLVFGDEEQDEISFYAGASSKSNVSEQREELDENSQSDFDQKLKELSGTDMSSLKNMRHKNNL